MGISEILKTHIKKKDGKYIIFCKDIAHLEEMKPIVEKWFKEINSNVNL